VLIEEDWLVVFHLFGWHFFSRFTVTVTITHVLSLSLFTLQLNFYR
jgi:hypothetical protein